MTMCGYHQLSQGIQLLADDVTNLAEGMGFEPTIRLSSYNGLANRRLQPLGHPSTVGSHFLAGLKGRCQSMFFKPLTSSIREAKRPRAMGVLSR